VCYTRIMSDKTEFDWIQQARDNGWETPLRLTLDVLEPFGVLGAQMLWVLQPTLGFFISSDLLRDLARTLEQPGGIEAVRRQLDATNNTD
jgi:hypothetical protein